jgi:[ribosomal protein S5]-alanine N-acetyltransferase
MDFPEIATSNYRLRQIVPQDQQFIFQGLSHPQVIRYYGVRYETFETAKAQMDWYESLWRNKTGIWWIIAYKEEQPLGACGFNYYNSIHQKIELGFWLLPEHQGKGIMKEVLPVIINYIFTNWQVHRIEALVEEGNDASTGLLERSGFTREGLMRDCEIKDGRFISLIMLSLINPHH